MKKFTLAEIELVSFDSEDIIVTSGFKSEDDDFTEE